MKLLQSRNEEVLFRSSMHLAGWEAELRSCYCGAKTCADGSKLLRCSKCKIVAYVGALPCLLCLVIYVVCCQCGVEHQRANWREHKTRCFKASWE